MKAELMDATVENPCSSFKNNSVCGGVCMMNNWWREKQQPAFINFIISFLAANSFRLNFVPISPDLIFNCGGLSVAFIFVTQWDEDCSIIELMFSRAKKLKAQFAHLYVVATLQTRQQNDSFVHSYFKYGMKLARPTFVPVEDIEMGFEKIVKIALSCGEIKQQEAKSKLKAERKQSVQTTENFLRVLTSIPGIDNHDANSLQAMGSIEVIAKASKGYILENTDISAEKAEIVERFFRDSKFYLTPKIN